MRDLTNRHSHPASVCHSFLASSHTYSSTPCRVAIHSLGNVLLAEMASSMDVEEIESACEWVAKGTDNAQRKRGEDVLMKFKEMPSPYVLCGKIVRASSMATARFHAVQCIRNAIIRDWSSLPRPQLHQMANFLFESVSKNGKEEGGVRGQIFLTAAVIIKLDFSPSLSTEDGTPAPLHP